MKHHIAVAVTAVALSLGALPAEAAWHGYVSREIGFSFNAPAGMKAEKTTYDIANTPKRPATLFRIMEDNIEYRVTVVDVGTMSEGNATMAASIRFQGGGRKLLSDEEARVESTYGHKMSVELPNNGGRSMAAIYFKKGHLIQLDATVLPANGDYGTPDVARFADSIAFGDDRVDANATELKLLK